MARTALPITAVPANYAETPVGLTWTALDATNNNSFVSTGHEILLVQNTDTLAHTITIHSNNDSYGRTGDITAFSLVAGDFYTTQKFPMAGWIQSDGTIWVDTTSALVKAVVLQTQPN